jgi:hypothetical protein
LLGNSSVKIPVSLPGNDYTRNNKRIVVHVVFNVARDISRKVSH